MHLFLNQKALNLPGEMHIPCLGLDFSRQTQVCSGLLCLEVWAFFFFFSVAHMPSGGEQEQTCLWMWCNFLKKWQLASTLQNSQIPFSNCKYLESSSCFLMWKKSFTVNDDLVVISRITPFKKGDFCLCKRVKAPQFSGIHICKLRNLQVFKNMLALVPVSTNKPGNQLYLG